MQVARDPISPLKRLSTGAEDFSFFQKVVPGVFYFVGVTPLDVDLAEAYSNHSPKFAPVIQPTLTTGTTAIVVAALAWLAQ